MEETTPRKTRARKAPTKEASTARRPIARKTTSVTSKDAAVKKSVRKAPTRVSGNNSPSDRMQWARLYMALSGFLLVLGVSAAIGFTDDGQINVSNTIASQSQQNPVYDEQGESVVPPTVPDMNANRPVNSGLVPSQRGRVQSTELSESQTNEEDQENPLEINTDGSEEDEQVVDENAEDSGEESEDSVVSDTEEEVSEETVVDDTPNEVTETEIVE